MYHAIVGVEPVAHPEIQWFLKGFLLPCWNGFTFSEVRSLPPLQIFVVFIRNASLSSLRKEVQRVF